MTLAPVVLFTFNRPEHTRSTLQALARNRLADQTDLVIFCDGPRSTADQAGVDGVRVIAHQVRGFRSVRIVERPSNFGLARSVISGVTEVIQASGRVIVVEDDLLTSRNFLTYMNQVLDAYKDDPNVFSVTGHTFPAKYLKIPNDYPFDTYAGRRCSSWSWGTWIDRWSEVDWEMTYYPEFCRNTALQHEFNRGGSDMTTLLHMQKQGRIDSWAIRFCYAHTATRRACIYPVRTLVKNIGLDNTGTHSRPEPRYEHPKLDETWLPERYGPSELFDERIAASFKAIFDPPPEKAARRYVRRAWHLLRGVARRARRAAGAVRRVAFPPSQPADVLFVNTYERTGGAARAAHRLFVGIRRHLPAARLLTLLKETADPDVIGWPTTSLRGVLARKVSHLEERLLFKYPGRVKALFTPARHPNPLRVKLKRFSPGLIHLHWVGRGLLGIEDLAEVKVPVVWTLHDAWAFSGGCHYAGACTKFASRCGACPQLGSEQEHDLSRSVFERKRDIFSALDLTVVAPSRWLAEQAGRSALLAGRRIEVIPNGLDLDVFKPIPQDAAKRYFGVDGAGPVFLFGAEALSDPRKGGDLLLEALARFPRRCTLMTFGGHALPPGLPPEVTVKPLGLLFDEASLALAYSAADAFVCPSREDNLPNTVAEALACGTPCIAFDVNGLPEMIRHLETGWLAPAFDPAGLAEGLDWIASLRDRSPVREVCRRKAMEDYDLRVTTGRYRALYRELLAGRTA